MGEGNIYDSNIHKINNISDLVNIPMDFGVEVDPRHNRGRIIMNHDISDDSNTTFFEDYLEKYNHGLLVVNIKESEIEKDVIKLLEKMK